MLKHYHSLTRAFVVVAAAIVMVAAKKPAQFYLRFQISAESADYYYVRTRTKNDNPRGDERNLLFATTSETNKYTLAYFSHEDFVLKHKPGKEEIGTDISGRLTSYPAGVAWFKMEWNDQAKEYWLRFRFPDDSSLYLCSSTQIDEKVVAIMYPNDLSDPNTGLHACVAFDHFVVVKG